MQNGQEVQSTRTKKLPGVISVRDPVTGWMKDLKCVQFTAFENGSAMIVGTIPSKGKTK
jgi:hypothetical protein